MTEWFKDWFDTQEYLQVYRHRNNDDAQKLVDLILNNIELPAFGNILDMACGSGRHSILFAEKGYPVTAVDLSTNLLNTAKHASEKAGVKINFIQSDLRTFSIRTKFSLVVNLFTSFGYFEDECENLNILVTAFDHLVKKGYFIIDYFNSGFITRNLVKESCEDFEDEKIIQRRYIEGNRVNKQIIIRKNDGERYFRESVRMYTKDELFNAIQNTGFTIVNCFGDSCGKPFDLESSPRIIIIARK